MFNAVMDLNEASPFSKEIAYGTVLNKSKFCSVTRPSCICRCFMYFYFLRVYTHLCSSYSTYRLEVDVYVCLQKKKWMLLGWLPYPMTLTLMCRRPGTSIIESYHYILITRFRHEPSDRHWGASSRSYRAHPVSVDARTLMYMYSY